MGARRLNIFLVKAKGVLSTLIMVLFIPVAISGIGLYFAPNGPRARASSWRFLGLTKFQLTTLHDLPGIIFLTLIAVHLLLNLKLYYNEIKCLFLQKQ